MAPSVKYELTEIERLIREGEQRPVPKKAALAAFEEQLRLESERIRNRLVHEVFTFEDERHLERYIQFHQAAVISLLDKLSGLMRGHGDRPELFARIYGHLDGILRFIERHFAKYFDQDARAPEGYLALARKDAGECLPVLVKSFADRHADEKIVFLLLQVLQAIVASTEDHKVTFREVMYAKELKKELYRLLEQKPSGDINEDLRQIMYYLNYNSVKVVTYHAHYIGALLESADTRTEKIERLSLVFKTISQAQVKPEIKFNQHAPPLKDQLAEYISVEMEYQQRLQALNTPAGQRPDTTLPGFKLKFETSLAQLAYLIRVFLETRFISNDNLTHILQFLASFAITKRSEAISFTSFRTKFYNVENGTKQSVRGILTAMIHYIDRS